MGWLGSLPAPPPLMPLARVGFPQTGRGGGAGWDVGVCAHRQSVFLVSFRSPKTRLQHKPFISYLCFPTIYSAVFITKTFLKQYYRSRCCIRPQNTPSRVSVWVTCLVCKMPSMEYYCISQSLLMIKQIIIHIIIIISYTNFGQIFINATRFQIFTLMLFVRANHCN